jgi:hypothetical protein
MPEIHRESESERERDSASGEIYKKRRAVADRDQNVLFVVVFVACVCM